MDSITQAEYNKRFAQFVRDKELRGEDSLNRDNILDYKLELMKLLKNEGLTVRAGFSVNEKGEVEYDDH